MIGIMLFVIIIYLCACIRIVSEYERITVLRLGQFIEIKGPGLVMLLFPIDKGIKVDLNHCLPGWQGMSKEDLNAKVKELALSNPDMKK